jgi:hypothetical protein
MNSPSSVRSSRRSDHDSLAAGPTVVIHSYLTGGRIGAGLFPRSGVSAVLRTPRPAEIMRLLRALAGLVVLPRDALEILKRRRRRDAIPEAPLWIVNADRDPRRASSDTRHDGEGLGNKEIAWRLQISDTLLVKSLQFSRSSTSSRTEASRRAEAYHDVSDR